MSINEEQFEWMIKSLARAEIVAFLDTLVEIIEGGTLTDPLEIIKGARNVIIKRDMQPLLDQVKANLSTDRSEG